MSYEIFCNLEIGAVKELFLDFGMIRFVKCASTQFFVEVLLKNERPFVYTSFTQVMPCIEASSLYDIYSK